MISRKALAAEWISNRLVFGVDLGNGELENLRQWIEPFNHPLLTYLACLDLTIHSQVLYDSSSRPSFCQVHFKVR